MNIEISAKTPINSQKTQVEQPSDSIQTGLSQAVTSEQTKEEKPATIAQPEEAVEAKSLADVLEELNKAIPIQAHQLQFSIDENVNRTVVSVIDKESGDVIRQLPSEEAIALATRLRETVDGADKAIGVLINSKI